MLFWRCVVNTTPCFTKVLLWNNYFACLALYLIPPSPKNSVNTLQILVYTSIFCHSSWLRLFKNSMFQSSTHIIYFTRIKTMFYCWYCKYKRYKYMYMLSTNAIITNCDISVNVSWVTEPKNKNSKKKSRSLLVFIFWMLPFFFEMQKL